MTQANPNGNILASSGGAADVVHGGGLASQASQAVGNLVTQATVDSTHLPVVNTGSTTHGADLGASTGALVLAQY